jgi:hypothetical protein
LAQTAQTGLRFTLGYGPSTYDTFLDRLNGIRLATVLHPGKKGETTIDYQLEELQPEQLQLVFRQSSIDG